MDRWEAAKYTFSFWFYQVHLPVSDLATGYCYPGTPVQ